MKIVSRVPGLRVGQKNYVVAHAPFQLVWMKRILSLSTERNPRIQGKTPSLFKQTQALLGTTFSIASLLLESLTADS